MKKRILSVLLALCMVLCLAPAAVFAEGDDGAGTAERNGIALGSGGIQADDVVYYGVYTENSASYEVPWYVLDANGFFLSKYTLGSSNCRKSGDDLYNTSALRDVMDGFYNGNTTLFTNTERNAIKETILSGKSIYYNEYLGKIGEDMAAYVFPLSYDDIDTIGEKNPKFVTTAITDPEGEGMGWWTRTSTGAPIYISEEGDGWVYGYPYPNLTSKGVRPAFNLNLNSVLFTSAAAGGKADTAVDENLTAVTDYTGNEWKLTLKDSNRSFSANVNGQTSASASAGGSVQIAYSGAQTGESEYVSVLLCDSNDKVLYYGNIAQSSASGTASVTIPADLAVGDYTLKVFSEQCNGYRKTDYASDFQNISLTVEPGIYLISTVEELKAFRDKVNGGNANINAKLMNDIVLNDGTFDENGNWSKEGTPNEWTPINDYTGIFDGNGKTVNGLYVTNEMYAGLFGSVRGGTVKNVTVTGYVEGTQYVGGIVGYGTYATVSGCTNHAAVKAKNEILYVGGIVGFAYYQGIVTGCTNTGAVTAFPIEGSSYWGDGSAGGIVGRASTGDVKNPNAVSITACANFGKVSVFIDSDKAGAYVGGIVGSALARAIATDCFNAGDLSITERNATCEDTYLGGVIGITEGDVADLPRPYTSGCYSIGTLTHTGSGPVGICGIVGYARSYLTVDRCYWLVGTAETAADDGSNVTNTSAKTKAEFADGTVLNLLKGDRTDSPWADECQYLAAAGMTLPVFKGQGGSHAHDYQWKHTDTEHWKECACGLIDKNSKGAHSGTDDGDCTTAVKCVCGYQIEAAQSSHDWSDWAQDSGKDTHTRKCQTEGCTVSETKPCSGGTATCTAKAKCDTCKVEYGSVNAKNHPNLKHVEAKAATKWSKGNIEYWHCSDCGKYYKDAAATQEITKEQTVTNRLPFGGDPSDNPKTGADAAPNAAQDSSMTLWIAVLLACAAAGTFAVICMKKKKQSEN